MKLSLVFVLTAGGIALHFSHASDVPPSDSSSPMSSVHSSSQFPQAIGYPDPPLLYGNLFKELVDFLSPGRPGQDNERELKPDTAVYYATHSDANINLQGTAADYARGRKPKKGIVVQEAIEWFLPDDAPNSDEPPPMPCDSDEEEDPGYSSNREITAPWFKIVSAAFAEATRGSADALLPAEGVLETSYWILYEWPQLQHNNIAIRWIDYTNYANTKILWQPGDPKFSFPANTPIANIGVHPFVVQS